MHTVHLVKCIIIITAMNIMMMMMVARKSSSDRRIFGDRRLLISMMVSLSYEDGQVFNEFCLFDIVDKNDCDKRTYLSK